jgi:hypothetical protein
MIESVLSQKETRTMIIALVSFSYSCSQETLSDLAMDFATNVTPNIEGLIWKIYLNEPERKRSAGLYLFRDLQCANAYLNGPYVRGLGESPIVSKVSTETFETMREPSIRSAGPILEPEPAGADELHGSCCPG